MRVMLEKYRNRRRLNQTQLAKLSTVPQPMISDIETGIVKNPTIKTLFRLAKALNCTVDDLIEESEDGWNEHGKPAAGTDVN